MVIHAFNFNCVILSTCDLNQDSKKTQLIFVLITPARGRVG